LSSKTADASSILATPAISNYKAFQAFGRSFILTKNSKKWVLGGKMNNNFKYSMIITDNIRYLVV